MPLLLQVAAWGVEVADERVVRAPLERHRIERRGTRDDLLMRPDGAALGTEQVVHAVDFVQVWAFDEFDIGAAPNRAFGLRAQAHGLDVELGKRDAIEGMVVFTEIPSLLDEVLAPVIVMEQACIEANAVDPDRFAPRATDVLGGHGSSCSP